MSAASSKPQFKSVLFRLTRGTLDQLDALAQLPECGGNKTAVIRQAVAEFFEKKFPATTLDAINRVPARTSGRKRKST